MSEAKKAMARAYAALVAADKVIDQAKPYVRGSLQEKCALVKQEASEASEELERVRLAQIASENRDYVPLVALSIGVAIILLLEHAP